MTVVKPQHLDIKRTLGLTIEWENNTTSFFPVLYLRKMSPAADQKKIREELANNPLAILPQSAITGDKPVCIDNVEFVGHYAIRIRFNDGHDTGIYSWEYLHEIDPDNQNK